MGSDGSARRCRQRAAARRTTSIAVSDSVSISSSVRFWIGGSAHSLLATEANATRAATGASAGRLGASGYTGLRRIGKRCYCKDLVGAVHVIWARGKSDVAGCG